MRILTWNLEWARPASRRERIIREALLAANADIVCLTEAYAQTLPDDGHLLEAGSGNPVADRKGAKKVLLWARNFWRDSSTEDSFSPRGRIVSGVTDTEAGAMRIIGVCIPWPGSNTPRFGGDRKPWDDHLLFLQSLSESLSRLGEQTVMLGDFNQRLPRQKQPRLVADAIEDALAGLNVSTRGFAGADGGLTIDHIAHTPDLRLTELAELPRHQQGIRLSDHFGVVGKLSRA